MLLSLVVLTIACSETRHDDSATSTSTMAVPVDAGRFEWPDDPDHPRVALEVELPARTGTIRLELMPELAPESVRRFLDLARAGHYDGTTFHRVVPGFMIQGGDPNSRDLDPNNDGRGGDRSPIPDEHSSVPFGPGVVALANRGHPGTTSSQFFIMNGEHRGLDGQYNVVGRVVAGEELVDAIAHVETDAVGRWGPKNRPIENVVIRGVSVTEAGGSASGDALAESRSD